MSCFSTGAVRVLAISILLCISAAEGSYAASAAHQAALRRARRTEHKFGGSSIRVALRGGKANTKTPEELEEYKDGGLALTSVMTKSQLEVVGTGITGAAYSDKLHEVANAGKTGEMKSRFIGGPGNEMARQYFQNQLKDLGLDVWTEDLAHTRDIQPYIEETSKPKNLFGQLTGSDLSKEVIVIGAHFDSVNWKAMDFGETISPGVDDNGSGTAAVLLAAKALAAAPKPRRTIIFALFNGEEEGLVGSEQFAQKAATGKYGDVKAAIILDEVAWTGKGGSTKNQAIFETVGKVPGAMALVDTIAKVNNMGFPESLERFVVNRHGFGSDHMSFLHHGIPALLLIERDDLYHADTWGHSAEDDFDHMGTGWDEYGAKMTRLAVRTVASLASPSGAAVAKTDILASSSPVKQHSHVAYL